MALAIAWPRSAAAVGPVDIEGGGMIGYGTNPSHGPTPFGVGIGFRVGAAVRDIYLGFALTYYFGDSGDCGGGAPNMTPGQSSLSSTFCNAGAGEVSLGQRAVLYGGDIGYTLTVPRAKFFKIRPLVQLGDAEITRTGTLGPSDITTAPGLSQYRSTNNFYVQPGVTAFVTTEGFFIGADVNLLILPSVVDLAGVTATPSGGDLLTTDTHALFSFTAHAQLGFRF